ncbi:hypothetical protein [Psychromicrobium sp. YIM B11713]|uniref:hypothetical protein n=1 Tax=Psychromicrobium sp. YIM B11713 TaxID=3145233 RepID=UPI00374F6E08
MTVSIPRVDDSATHIGALRRHFADLRDSNHGGATSRPEKERLFRDTTELLAPYSLQALEEINDGLLLGQGTIADSGVVRDQELSLLRSWTLNWNEQKELNLPPITLLAYYGVGFHHPHLRGGTVREWPLNVFTDEQAKAELPVLRAIAEAELHNLVFYADYRIVPATSAIQPLHGTGFIR